MTPSVATVEQQVRAALSAFYREKGFSDASYLSDNASPKGQGTTTFPPPLPLDGAGDGWAGEGFTSAIRQLNDLAKSTRDVVPKQTTTALQAYALFATGQDENAVELLHESRFLEDVDLQAFKSTSSGEGYNTALIMMGYTVYGMANERLFLKRQDDGYLPFAFAGYACTIDLHEGIRGGQSAKALRGLPADEIESWGELALYRNALLGVRHGSTALGLNSLRAYQANAGRWPSNFRVSQRMVIFRTYLATLNRDVEQGTYTPPPSNTTPSRDDCRSAAYQSSVIATSASRVEIRDFESERTSRLGSAKGLTNASNNAISSANTTGAARTTSKRRPAPYRTIRPTSSTWNNEVLTVQRATADAISRTSQFPHAGKVNKAALDLADELIRGWRYSGEQGGYEADELAETLYTLSRYTFHSQRISRHLFTILVAAENYDEARKALNLYIQIVDKAREGDAADAAALVEEAKRREAGHDAPATNGNVHDGKEANGIISKEAEESAQEVHIDADSDEIFINTLLFASHVYCRYLKDAAGAIKLIEKVTSLLEKSESQKAIASDKLLYARIKRVSGAVKAAYCRAIHHSGDRSVVQDEALSLLKQAVTYDDQSSETFFQLGLLQNEMLETASAIRSARRAVELEPANVEYWHLLTLLVSAQKDARGALQVAEEGLAEAEDDEEAELSPTGQTNGVRPGSRGGSGSNVGARTSLLSMDYPPNSRERNVSILQLMITHNSLEELVEGTQAAIEAQREIFDFFHRRIPSADKSLHAVVPTSSLKGQELQVPGHNTGADQHSRPLTGATQPPKRFNSVTGMGQSGSSHHLLDGVVKGLHAHHRDGNASVKDGTLKSGTNIVPPSSGRDDDQLSAEALSNAGIRNSRHEAEETSLLSSLWLMTAATFRREGNLSECRRAIQEAERVDPVGADVWVQLALWFEQQLPGQIDGPPVGLAIQSLYKALACDSDHVSATVHLARLFVTHPLNPHIKDEYQQEQLSLKGVASPLPQTSEYVQVSSLASDLLAQTQSRKISSRADSVQESHRTLLKKSSEERKRLSTLSMAEGLLVSLSQNQGWNCPEAWLYLGRVMQHTHRPERQRECLQYALQTERSKPIRPLHLTINPAC